MSGPDGGFVVVVVDCAGADVVVVVGAEVVVVVCAGAETDVELVGACVVVVVCDGPNATERAGGLVVVFFFLKVLLRFREFFRLRCERLTDESACLWVRAVVRGADVLDES